MRMCTRGLLGRGGVASSRCFHSRGHVCSTLDSGKNVPHLPTKGVTPNQETSELNYANLYRRTMNLLKKYNNERQTTASTLPLMNRKRSNAVKDQQFDYSHPENDKMVTELIRLSVRSGDAKQMFSLCSRLEALQYTPTPEQISLIITVITEHSDYRYSAVVLLNLLRLIVENDMTVDEKTIHRIRWCLRSSQDVFIVEKGHELLLQHFSSKYPRLINDVVLMGDKIHSLIQGNEIELAYYSYRSVIRSIGANDMLFRTLPAQLLLNRVMAVLGASQEAMVICRDLLTARQTITIATWEALLSLSIYNKDYDTAYEVMQKIGDQQYGTIGNQLIEDILKLAGEFGDLEMVRIMLQERVRRGQLTLSPALAASVVDSFAATNNLENILAALETIFLLQPDLSDKDMPAVLEYIGTMSKDPDIAINIAMAYSDIRTPAFRTLVMNIILSAYFEHWSPSAAFFAYRKLVNTKKFTPDERTLEVLVESAVRIGNSKKLGHAIYRELVDEFNVTPTRHAMEGLVKLSTVGTKFDSALYFVAEMIRRQIPLREVITRSVRNAFSLYNDPRLDQLLTNPSEASKYTHFPDDDTVNAGYSRSSHRGYLNTRDDHLCKDFVEGWQKRHIKRRTTQIHV